MEETSKHRSKAKSKENDEDELSTIRFLRSNKTQVLTSKFGISIKKHGVHKNLLSFHYSQLNSPMNNAIVQECRGNNFKMYWRSLLSIIDGYCVEKTDFVWTICQRSRLYWRFYWRFYRNTVAGS
jgi:hypothetical protein